VRSSQVTPARRSGQLCAGGVRTHPWRVGCGSGPETVARLNRKHWRRRTGIGGGFHRNTQLPRPALRMDSDSAPVLRRRDADAEPGLDGLACCQHFLWCRAGHGFPTCHRAVSFTGLHQGNFGSGFFANGTVQCAKIGALDGLAASQSRPFEVVAWVLAAAPSDGEVFQRLPFGQLRDQPTWPVAATGPGVVTVLELHGHLLALGLRLAAHGRRLRRCLFLPPTHLAEEVIACQAVVRDSLPDARDDASCLLLPQRVRLDFEFFDLQLNLRVGLG